jgi:hypothetical protein
MEKGDVELVVFKGRDFDYWKNWIHNNLLTQGSYHLGDHAGGVRDPNDARQHDPSWAAKL